MELIKKENLKENLIRHKKLENSEYFKNEVSEKIKNFLETYEFSSSTRPKYYWHESVIEREILSRVDKVFSLRKISKEHFIDGILNIKIPLFGEWRKKSGELMEVCIELKFDLIKLLFEGVFGDVFFKMTDVNLSYDEKYYENHNNFIVNDEVSDLIPKIIDCFLKGQSKNLGGVVVKYSEKFKYSNILNKEQMISKCQKITDYMLNNAIFSYYYDTFFVVSFLTDERLPDLSSDLYAPNRTKGLLSLLEIKGKDSLHKAFRNGVCSPGVETQLNKILLEGSRFLSEEEYNELLLKKENAKKEYARNISKICKELNWCYDFGLALQLSSKEEIEKYLKMLPVYALEYKKISKNKQREFAYKINGGKWKAYEALQMLEIETTIDPRSYRLGILEYFKKNITNFQIHY